MTIARKPDAARILQHIQNLKAEPWLGQPRKWWPDFVFRVDDIEAAASILNSGRMLSRAAATAAGVMPSDCASPQVIANTSEHWKKYVRLYFRPRTPTQYDSEGLRPPGQRKMDAHCPVPVVTLFDSGEILTRANTEFSEGNLGAGGSFTGNDAEYLESIPFKLVYHDTWFDPPDRSKIIFHRHAEVIVPNELDLVALRFVGIETPDPAATVAAIVAAPCLNDDKTAIIQWDIVRGLTSLNKLGQAVLLKITADHDDLRARTQNPTEALILASTFPDKVILFFHNAHRWIENESVAQAVWLLRDLFKANERMLVLLAPALRFPSELERDIIVLDEALPDDEARKAIVLGLHIDANLKPPSDAVLTKVVEASRGLAAFPTEQVVAMALKKDGIVVSDVWARKRKMIEQSRGLMMFTANEKFSDVGGIFAAKQFAVDLFNGNKPPTCIVFLDELEKSMAGATSDSSGTSQDQHGQILSTMDTNEWSGMLTVGPPGCTKSMYAKAMGASFNVPVLSLDLGALKGSLVGQSEQQIRTCLKTIEAIAEDGALNAVVEKARRLIAGVNPKDIRDDAKFREETAKGFVQLKSAAEKLVIDKPKRAINFD